MRVLVVHIIFADVNHRQIPKAREVHHLVKQPLAKRPCAENAAPVAIPALPPTIAFAPKFPLAGSAMCIDPPLPRQYPASFPSSSANMRSGAAPLARQCPCPRCVLVM